MVEEGLFDKFPCDAVFAIHNKPGIPLGQWRRAPGRCWPPPTASTSHQGSGSHAAHPHLGIDPFVIGAQIVLALQTIAGRNVDPIESAVVSIGFMQGGTTYNVIPDGLQSAAPSAASGRRCGTCSSAASARSPAASPPPTAPGRARLSPPLSADHQPRRRGRLRRRRRGRDLRRGQVERSGPPSMGAEDFSSC